MVDFYGKCREIYHTNGVFGHGILSIEGHSITQLNPVYMWGLLFQKPCNPDAPWE